MGRPITSMDIITDRYISLGYQGTELRKILEKEKEYQKLLNERKQKLYKKYRLTTAEKNKYSMPSDRDYEILDKCKKLKRLKLSKEDKYIVEFILTQLYDDWRKPLLEKLNNLLRKYEVNKK